MPLLLQGRDISLWADNKRFWLTDNRRAEYKAAKRYTPMTKTGRLRDSPFMQPTYSYWYTVNNAV
jgi:hypothetical protein